MLRIVAKVFFQFEYNVNILCKNYNRYVYHNERYEGIMKELIGWDITLFHTYLHGYVTNVI